MVSLQVKKSFLKYVINNCNLKRSEGAWFLSSIMNDDDVLDKVIFSDNVDYCDNYAIVSTKGVEGSPFVFKNKDFLTNNLMEAIRILRRLESCLYVEINFLDEKDKREYMRVFEDNPFFNTDILFSMGERELLFEKLLEYNELTYVNYLTNKIDESLDNNDKDSFKFYCEKLVNLDISIGVKI